MYALYIHNKHDTDWSDKSYHKIMIFDDTKFNQFTNGLNYYNTMDYDITISKNDLIPNNENNVGMHRIDFSFRDTYENIIIKFCDMIKMMYNGDIDKYKPKFMSLIVKTDLACVRLVTEYYSPNIYTMVLKSITGGESNFNVTKEFHNEIGSERTHRKEKTWTKDRQIKTNRTAIFNAKYKYKNRD